MGPIRIVEYVLLLILAVGSAYVTYTQGLAWSRAGGIVIPLVVIVLLFVEDRKR